MVENQVTISAELKDVLTKRVRKQGPNSGVVYVPRDWIGREVHVVLADRPEVAE